MIHVWKKSKMFQGVSKNENPAFCLQKIRNDWENKYFLHGCLYNIFTILATEFQATTKVETFGRFSLSRREYIPWIQHLSNPISSYKNKFA
jgi:hypothetical protein